MNRHTRLVTLHQCQDAGEPQPIKRAQLRMLNLHCGDKRNVQAFGLSFNASVQSAILLVLDLMTLLNHVRHLAIGRESNSASLELAEQSIPEGAQTIQAWLQRNCKNAKDAAHDEKTRCG